MKNQNSAAKMAALHTGGSRPVATVSADGDGTPSLPAGGSRPVATIAKCADFLAGRYGNLTTEEIAEFREAQADPDGSKWELEYAGEAFFVDPLELNGFLLVEMPSGETLEESLAHLRRIVGARTITPDRLWWIARHVLGRTEVKRQECRFPEEQKRQECRFPEAQTRQECRFPEVQPIGEAALSPLLPAEKEMNHDR